MLKIIVAEHAQLSIEARKLKLLHPSIITLCQIVPDSEIEDIYSQERILTSELENANYLRALLYCANIELSDEKMPSNFSFDKAQQFLATKSMLYPSLATALFSIYLGEFAMNRVTTWGESSRIVEQVLTVGVQVLLVEYAIISGNR